MPVALQSEPISKFLGIKMFIEPPSTTSFQASEGTTSPDCAQHLLGLLPPCSGPRTPFQSLRATSACSSDAAAGLVSSSSQPCPDGPWALLHREVLGPTAGAAPAAHPSHPWLPCSWLGLWDVPGGPPDLPVP